MARSRKSHDTTEEITKSHRGIKPPYSAKTGGNIYVVYADLRKETDEYARVLVMNFAEQYAARWFILSLIGNDEWEYAAPIGNRSCLRTSSGIRLSMFNDHLQSVIDYEPTEAELEWSDDSKKQSIAQFKYGRHESAKAKIDEESDDDRADTAEPKRKAARAPKEVKAKPDLSGYVSANDIAKELKVEAREVRGVLRSLQLVKPAHGWSWPKDEAEKIKKQIEKGLKK